MAIFRVPIVLTFPGAGSPGANIWHIRTVDPSFATELTQANTLIGYIRTLYAATAAYFPNGWTAQLGTVVEEGSQREIVPTMASVAGSGSGSSPQMLAIVCTWKTTIAARRGRGRTFLGPLATAATQTDGTITDSVRTSFNTYTQGLVDSSVAFGNGAVGVWGYENPWTGTGPRPAGQPRVFRDFTGRNIRDVFGILRSRRD